MLSGGGARAAYQVGVLQAIAERMPELEIPIYTGVSAGAINTVSLASHPGPFPAAVRDLRGEWERLTSDQVYDVRATRSLRAASWWLLQVLLGRQVGPQSAQGLLDMEPLRRFLASCVDMKGIAGNIAARRLRAVALSATCYGTGETITFVQGGEDVTTWERAQRRAVYDTLTLEHVMASAAIPIVFRAIQLESGYCGFFGDGSVRQTAPLAPAIHLGARRILAIGMRANWGDAKRPPPRITAYPTPAEVMGLLLHAVFLDALEADAERLWRINQILAALPPGTEAPGDLRPIRLLLLRPSLDLGALARPYYKQVAPVLRATVRATGGFRSGAADFVSYLLFDPVYTMPLIELGYDDGKEQWPEIERFLGDD